jgi:hypothetical protein
MAITAITVTLTPIAAAAPVDRPFQLDEIVPEFVEDADVPVLVGAVFAVEEAVALAVLTSMPYSPTSNQSLTPQQHPQFTYVPKQKKTHYH